MEKRSTIKRLVHKFKLLWTEPSGQYQNLKQRKENLGQAYCHVHFIRGSGANPDIIYYVLGNRKASRK